MLWQKGKKLSYYVNKTPITAIYLFDHKETNCASKIHEKRSKSLNIIRITKFKAHSLQILDIDFNPNK